MSGRHDATIGRLRAVNLDTHRLQVTDDVGNKVALPHVTSDADVGSLLGRYVAVVGAPEFDAKGRLAQIHEAVIEAAAPIPGMIGAREAVPVEDILASAPGADFGAIPGLTKAEAESYLKAIGFRVTTVRAALVDTDVFSALYVTPAEVVERQGHPVAAWRAALTGQPRASVVPQCPLKPS